MPEMGQSKRFYQLLKRDFSPLLRAVGFKGSGATFRRIRNDVIHVVNIQGSGAGDRCCVNLSLHYTFLPTTVTDLKKLKAYDCAFRDRVHEEHESDHWWRYGATEDESEVGVACLIDLFQRRGTSFFKRFEPFPEVFESITPADLDAGNLSRLPVAMTVVRAALTMAHIMRHVRHYDKCRAFAEAGLRQNAIGLRPEFERLMSAGE